MLLADEVKEFNRTGEPLYLFRVIKDTLKYSNLSITDIQKTTKLSRQAIYNIINSKNIPKLDTLQKILNKFGYKISIKKIESVKKKIA